MHLGIVSLISEFASSLLRFCFGFEDLSIKSNLGPVSLDFLLELTMDLVVVRRLKKCYCFGFVLNY